jgi:hypothetical protein
MALTKPSMAVNIITSIATTSADRGLTEAQFKAKFDETPAAIKTYLESLCDEIDAEKAEITTITTDSTSTTPTVTLASNNEYRFTDDAITTLGITIPAGLSADFIASVVWRNPTPTATLTVTNSSGLTLKNSGDDTFAGTFTPAVSKTYNMVFFHDGVNINCVIRGA